MYADDEIKNPMPGEMLAMGLKTGEESVKFAGYINKKCTIVVT